MIRVLIVDDSATARAAIRLALSGSPDMVVVAEAADGEEALRMCKRRDPDIVTMDVFLRRENGFQVARRIMAESPRPVVVVTGADHRDPKLAYQALEVGALEVVGKLPAPRSSSYEQRRRAFLRLLRTLAQVPVVHRFNPPAKESPNPLSAHRERGRDEESTGGGRLVILGASTGGPPLLSQIFSRLPKPLPFSTVVVQHIARGFAHGFAQWLADASGQPTVLVGEPCVLRPGTIYVAPDHGHLVFTAERSVKAVGVAPGEDSPKSLVPCIDKTFLSAARYFGAPTTAGLLTGMGKDGSRGLLALKEAGADTFAQKLETCAVSSMPKAAESIGAASSLLDPEEIVSRLLDGSMRGPGPPA